MKLLLILFSFITFAYSNHSEIINLIYKLNEKDIIILKNNSGNYKLFYPNPNITVLSNSEWVKFTLYTTDDEVFVVKNFKLDWGHTLYEKPISEIENAEFDIKHNVTFGCEGALWSSTGTSGSYDIYHKNNVKICTVVFDSPWAVRNYLNIKHDFENSKYNCISSSWGYDGPLGDISIKCLRIN